MSHTESQPHQAGCLQFQLLQIYDKGRKEALSCLMLQPLYVNFFILVF